MISEGLNLALFGMGAVFIFLVLLILITKLMSFFLYDANAQQNVVSSSQQRKPRTAQPAAVAVNTQDNAALTLVFAAAIKEYKKTV